ncbi:MULTISPECIES: methylated-DNA--[protein]-cysteine S-methyltransferase [Bacillaceae]|uniref:methylated-DNA--[protein]-cysteine S-methyltransferase n=1 Tax=Bacillaceae TaxID=186817 RepID=UPI001C5A47C6|nr:methylated-DNA--[protein]-cysteine S-methyltransferase [Rossellomorea sp. YZS02]MBW3114109.1 methylated-DNA--[protein]-cysteine S-methyltransferase [Bacillus sp. MCCB 382]MDX8342859.1 methylated-DNA--[protein]-cysteine S-methyltransferase [Rossellomorea sp. YZS02]
MSFHSITIASPIGNLKLSADQNQLLSVQFVEEEVSNEADHPILLKAKEQLHEFFNGERRVFDLPLKIEGTDFQLEVWNALQDIPYGETCSYQDLAETVRRPKAVRAVGQANKANRFPIIIPCHRVIGKNKKLTGYAGTQIDKKEILLSLES